MRLAKFLAFLTSFAICLLGFSRSLALLAFGNGISGISAPKKEHNFSQPFYITSLEEPTKVA